jgi:hypothetical protein
MYKKKKNFLDVCDALFKFELGLYKTLCMYLIEIFMKKHT